MRGYDALTLLGLITIVNAIVTYFYETTVVSCFTQCDKKSTAVQSEPKSKKPLRIAAK